MRVVIQHFLRTLFLSMLPLVVSACQSTGSDAPPRRSSPAPSTPPSSPTAAAPMPANDRTQVLQAVLDAPDLQQYLHPEIPTRVPVVIVKNEVVADTPNLQAVEVPVVFKPRAGLSESDAALEITRLEIAGDRATVELAYPIEGLVGTATLHRDGSGWVIDKLQLAER